MNLENTWNEANNDYNELRAKGETHGVSLIDFVYQRVVGEALCAKQVIFS